MAKKVKKKAVAKKTAKKKAVAKKTVKKKVTAKKKAASSKAVKKNAAVRKSATKKVGGKTVKKVTKKKTVIKKKAAVEKTVAKRRKRRKTNLSKAEMMHFRELLIVKLKEIMGDVDHLEQESLKKSRQDAAGDLSSMPIHMADVGSDNYEQEFALGLMDGERKIVKEIHAALKRIDNRTYGICEGTQEPIPKARLKGIPWTRYCVQYAEMLEKGLVVIDQDWYDGEDDEIDELDKGSGFHDDEDEADYEDDEEAAGLYFGFGNEDED